MQLKDYSKEFLPSAVNIFFCNRYVFVQEPSWQLSWHKKSHLFNMMIV